MKFLLTNDDGIDAPGIAALIAAAAPLGETVVVAPTAALSGCSHRVTTHGPIRVEARGAGRFAVDGTPADCVRLGLSRLAPRTGWVLSGINAGGNLGADVHHSGTVAAVREGVLHGWPGIAFSQYIRRGRPLDWEQAAVRAMAVLRELLAQAVAPGTFWNVNLPHLEPGAPAPRIVVCPVDPAPLPLSFREEAGQFHYNGNYHERPRQPGSDVDVCFRDRIAVSQIRLL